MSSLRKLRVLPGLLGGLLPLGLQPVSAGLLLVWLGGIDGLSRTWVAELGAEHRLILIEESVPSHTLLYLTVTDQAALEDVAHAVRKAQAQGFEVLLSARPPPGSRQP